MRSLGIKLIFYFIVFILIGTSCSSLVSFQKRHYRSGFYFHKATSNKIVKPFLSDCSLTKLKKNQLERVDGIYILGKEKLPNKKYTVIESKKQKSKIPTVVVCDKHDYSDTTKYLKKRKSDTALVTGNYYAKKAEKAKFKSTLYSILSGATFIGSFTNLKKDSFIIGFPISIIFLVLALISNYKRKGYLKLAEFKDKPIPVTEFYKLKAKRMRVMRNVFIALGILFFLGGFLYLLGDLYILTIPIGLVFFMLAILCNVFKRKLTEQSMPVKELTQKDYSLKEKRAKINRNVYFIFGLIFSLILPIFGTFEIEIISFLLYSFVMIICFLLAYIHHIQRKKYLKHLPPPKKTVLAKEPQDYNLKAKKAKIKRRIYWILALVLFLAIPFPVGDFFPLLFLGSLFFLILSLINNSRRKKYLRFIKLPNAPN